MILILQGCPGRVKRVWKRVDDPLNAFVPQGSDLIAVSDIVPGLAVGHVQTGGMFGTHFIPMVWKSDESGVWRKVWTGSGEMWNSTGSMTKIITGDNMGQLILVLGKCTPFQQYSDSFWVSSNGGTSFQKYFYQSDAQPPGVNPLCDECQIEDVIYDQFGSRVLAVGSSGTQAKTYTSMDGASIWSEGTVNTDAIAVNNTLPALIMRTVMVTNQFDVPTYFAAGTASQNVFGGGTRHFLVVFKSNDGINWTVSAPTPRIDVSVNGSMKIFSATESNKIVVFTENRKMIETSDGEVWRESNDNYLTEPNRTVFLNEIISRNSNVKVLIGRENNRAQGWNYNESTGEITPWQLPGDLFPIQSNFLGHCTNGQYEEYYVGSAGDSNGRIQGAIWKLGPE